MLYDLLDRTCELTGHLNGCWLMNHWRVGRWIVRRYLDSE